MMSELTDALSIWSWLKKNWEKRTTIILLLFGLVIIGSWLIYAIDFANVPNKVTWNETAGLIVLLCVIFLIWFLSRQPPKTKNNKIGLAIAINCETKKERQRLKMEFINAIRDEIQKGNRQQFDVVELSEYHSEKLDLLKNTTKYHRQTRAHLLIYGRCRIREHQGTNNYVLDLNASVRHIPIPKEVSTQLSQEMVQIFPRKTLIPVTEEVMGFLITKDIIRFAARYTLGAASLLSSDPFTAFDLHHGLWGEINDILNKEENPFPAYIIMRNKLPNYLIKEGLFLTSWCYTKKTENYLKEMDKYLTIVQELDPRNYSAHLLRGIYYFLGSRDVENAKKEIRKAKNDRDAAWKFSEAFLTAYEGNLEQAHKVYQRAFRGNVAPLVPLEVETFILDVLEKEPDKIQLWYCLGMINYLDKGDLASAKRDFSKFISLANENRQFETSVKFAKQYIDEIDRKMSKNQPISES